MKKLFFLVLLLAFAGCSRENVGKDLAVEISPAILSPIEFSDNTLSFDNWEDLYSTAAMLESFGEYQKAAWYAEKNFTSQLDAMWMASDQMDLCADVEQMDMVREYYSGLFVFNYDDETDYAFYLPTNDPSVANVVNAFGNVEIGGRLVNMNDISYYSETWQSDAAVEIMTRPQVEFTNEGVAYNRYDMPPTRGDVDRRLQVKASIQGDEVRIKFDSQKKNLLGYWRNYNQSVCRVAYLERGYGYLPNPRNPLAKPTVVPAYKNVLENPGYLYEHPEKKGPYTHTIATMNGCTRFSCKFLIYSRGISRDNGIKLNVKLP